MCARYTISAENLKKIATALSARILGENVEIDSKYNVAPSQVQWVIAKQDDGLVMQHAMWGFIPSWSKDNRLFVNAKSETVASLSTFRDAFKKNRCLVPSDGFFEWKGEQPPRQPYWFHRPGHLPFVFAGIYNDIKREAETIRTFAILTRAAEGDIASIHHRMPVAFDVNHATKWIEGKIDFESIALKDFQFYMVSKNVNKTSNDDSKNIEKIAEDQ